LTNDPKNNLQVGVKVPISMRIEFQVSLGPEGQSPTVGDLKEWLKIVTEHGAKDSDELLQMVDDRDELEGFFVYGSP
jgi:hypothetical protein